MSTPSSAEPPGADVSDPADHLSVVDRLLLLVLGWSLVLVGIAGLVLPALQGLLTLLLGGAVLSLVSRRAFELLHRLLHRWPKHWERLLGWRRWVVGHVTGEAEGSRPRLFKLAMVALVLLLVLAPLVLVPMVLDAGPFADDPEASPRPDGSESGPAVDDPPVRRTDRSETSADDST